VVLVKTQRVETSTSGVRYTPTTFFTVLPVGGSVVALLRYAPRFPKPVIRTARKRPSASSASSASTSWSRPWLSERKLSERESVHFTGRPSSRAACSSAGYSG
jgi:hypothetical protein